MGSIFSDLDAEQIGAATPLESERANLYIELGNTGAGSGIQGDFTNVALHIPEGGSSSLYLLLVGICCFGAIFASRKQLGNRA